MPQKYRLLSLIVICFTLLFFTWMIRDSLCELHIKQGSYELAAFFSLQFERVRVFGGKLFPPFLRRCAFSLHPNLFFTKNNTRFYYAIDYLFPEKQIKKIPAKWQGS
ncbi:type I toxin-antitoxin system toxin HokA [Escherichia coli]|nr:type I toxin-antitoxin system toxin HokA [Escherichia coli]